MSGRRDPYSGFRFLVEAEAVIVGACARVKGLARETRVETYREGGVNDFEYKLASLTTYGNLILERGLLKETLWNWHDQVVGGNIQRHKITVTLRDESSTAAWIWYVDGAYPVKWSVTDLDASSPNVLFESIEFAHHGIRRAA